MTATWLLLLGPPLLCLAVQAWALRRWRGAWRWLAALPVMGWVLWAASFARDVVADPSSHNLFPFEILLGSLMALAYLGVLAALRRITRKNA